MNSLLCRGIACLIVLFTSAPGVAAEPMPVPKVGASAMGSTIDQFITNARRQAESGSPEFKQLVAQLEPLRKKQLALLTTRGTKEAELARLQSAGGDSKRIAALQQEISACRSQLNVVDTQLQVLMYRAQPGPMPSGAGLPVSRAPAPGGGLLPASNGPIPIATSAPGSKGPIPVGGFAAASSGPLPAGGPTPSLLTRPVPPEKINAAAETLARSPAPSATAARTAATQILTANQPGYAPAEVDQLARLILQVATQTNDAALRAALGATKPAGDGKSGTPAPNQANNEIKFEIRIPPPEGQTPLAELQARQAKLRQATIELMKNSAAGPGPAMPVKK